MTTTMTGRIANCFILGAPKCGTTALVQYLSDHPRVYVTDPKEPHFFATDLDGYRFVRTMEKYETLFRGAGEEHDIRIDASVLYLYSGEAIRNIVAAVPGAQFIVMVRKPQEMIPSFHSQLLHSFDEDEVRFERAWRLCEARKRNQKIPRHCRADEVLWYDEIGKYAEQLQRVYEYVPHERVHIVVFDDFVRSVKEEYDKVTTFLGIEPQPRKDFEVINSNRYWRALRLARFLYKPPKGMNRSLKLLKRMLKVEKVGLTDKVDRLNTVRAARAPLPDALEAEIRDHYRPDVERLRAILGRELREW